MKQLGEIVKNFKVPPVSKKANRPRWQTLAFKVAAKLKDFEHVGIYMFWCRWYEEFVINAALEGTLAAAEKGNVKKKERYFTQRLMALGGALPPEAYANRRKKKINPQLALKL